MREHSQSTRLERRPPLRLRLWQSWNPLHGAPNQDNAPQMTSRFEEAYTWDTAGNLLKLKHTVGQTSWTRRFGMGGQSPDQWDILLTQHTGDTQWSGAPSNAPTHAWDSGQTSATHTYDAAGQLIAEGTSRHFEWDQAGRLKVYRTQVTGSEPSIYAIYLYDSAGQRLKKWVRRQGGSRIDTTVYIGGIYERHERVDSGVTTVNNTLHIIDGAQRIGTERVGPAFPEDSSPAIQYHLAEPHGTSNLVVDDNGSWCNREEYSPFGESVFGGFARKRYRYTGQERDEESGLGYHSARYYASWLCRWTRPDPAGLVDGGNLYCYVRGSPVRGRDPSGRQQLSSDSIGFKYDQPKLSVTEEDPFIEQANLTWESMWRAIDTMDEKSGRLITRTFCLLQAAGGAADMVLATPLVLAPEPLTTGLGIGLSFYGADQAAAGLLGVRYGQPVPSLLHRGVEGGALKAGASPQTASFMGTLAEVIGGSAGGAVAARKGLGIGGGGGKSAGEVSEGSKLVGPKKSGSLDDFEFTDPGNPTKGILAEIDETGLVTTVIEAGEGATVRGSEMFRMAMMHFGDNVTAVQGVWEYGDNLAKVNQLVSGGESLDRAVRQTWTARRAAEHGFTNVTNIEATMNDAGVYTSVIVRFGR